MTRGLGFHLGSSSGPSLLFGSEGPAVRLPWGARLHRVKVFGCAQSGTRLCGLFLGPGPVCRDTFM